MTIVPTSPSCPRRRASRKLTGLSTCPDLLRRHGDFCPSQGDFWKREILVKCSASQIRNRSSRSAVRTLSASTPLVMLWAGSIASEKAHARHSLIMISHSPMFSCSQARGSRFGASYALPKSLADRLVKFLTIT